MRPICLALDKLQGENNAFTGILQSTLSMTLKKLRQLKSSNSIAVCLPLVEVLVKSLKERFEKVFTNTDYAIATTLHPQFRLSMMSVLEEEDEENLFTPQPQDVNKRVKIKLISLVEDLLDAEDSSDANSD